MPALRLVLSALIVSCAVLLSPAQVAWAHVEVTADKPFAGAQNVRLTFVAEAESTTAGVVSLKVQLPPGITAREVRWLSGPTGWKLTPTTAGYTVAGPAVAPGTDVRYVVTVATLPATSQLLFKTIQTYADGQQDSWIEVSADPGVTPNKPAPALTLRAAPSTSAAATTAAPTATPTATAPATATATPTATTSSSPTHDGAAAGHSEPTGGDGDNGAAVFGIGAAALVIVVGGGYLLMRRRRPV